MAQEYPDQTYYPSSKVRLIIRFEEFEAKESKVKELAPKVPVTLAKGTKSNRAPLDVQEYSDPITGAKQWRLVQRGAPPPIGGPQNQDSSADGLTQVVGGIIPREANLGLNGTRQADTLNVSIRYIDLPIDPRTVRSCAIEFYLGTVKAEDFERGIAGATRGLTFGGNCENPNEPLNLVPDTYTDGNGTLRTNLRFQGWVDKWEADIGDDDEPLARLECRDNTQMLIDQIQPPKCVIASKEELDKGIADFLANFPQFAGLTVEYRPSGIPIPKLEEALSKTSYRPKQGPTPTGGAADKTSVMDYLTDICGSVGHNIRAEGSIIVVQPVRTLYSNEFSGRPDDSFKGRTLPSGKNFDSRHFIYGRNISSLRIERNFGKGKPTNVEVRCYSGEKKTTLVARFPLPGDQVVHPITGDKAEQKWLVWRVSGVKDAKTLRLLAQSVYDTQGRNEMSVSLQTYNLASFGGGNLDPDILDMKAGDPFNVLVHRDEEGETFSAITNLEGMLLVQSRSQAFLKSVGFSDSFASTYAKVYADRGFQSTFRLKSLGITWNVEDGVKLDIQGVNYIAVRAEKLLPKGEELEQGGKTKKDKQQAKKSKDETTAEKSQAATTDKETATSSGSDFGSGSPNAPNMSNWDNSLAPDAVPGQFPSRGASTPWGPR